MLAGRDEIALVSDFSPRQHDGDGDDDNDDNDDDGGGGGKGKRLQAVLKKATGTPSSKGGKEVKVYVDLDGAVHVVRVNLQEVSAVNELHKAIAEACEASRYACIPLAFCWHSE